MMETIMLNLIYLIFPITLYIIYCMYAGVFKKNTSSLLFVFSLATSFYLLLRFGKQEIWYLPIAIINIPLLLAYMNENIIAIVILNFITISYYTNFKNNIYFMIALIIYYLLYQLLYIKYRKKKLFVVAFTIVNVISISINIRTFEISLISYFIELLIAPYIITLAINSFAKIADLHKNLQDMEHEKQMKLSIFKITHEIKNPIAVCKGYLDMFDVSNSEHSQKFIPIIKSEIDRSLCLLQDFLDLNKIKLEKEYMDLTLLLEDIESSCQPLLKNNRIKFEERTSDCEELYLNGDYNRLKQVLINIIKNSAEALIGVKDPYINLYYKLRKDYIHIYVEDNGCGMSSEVLKKIKEPFFTTKGMGTGLGVTISHEVIQGHGGIIKYTSKENIGTKVEIILPLSNKYSY